jgi:hypothetical protein
MSSYISSNNNRFYVATEQSYGAATAITAENRIPAVRLTARQQREQGRRRDKTGTRTFLGVPRSTRRRTSYELSTYMTSWSNTSKPPAHGALFEAALGRPGLTFAGGSVAGVNGTQLSFASAHGLSAGQAITFGGEMRFVAAVVSATVVQLNAPFSTPPAAGSAIGPTVTYRPGATLASASIFDYWSPGSAVHRILAGAAVDQFTVSVNGDFHEFVFSGAAADMIDSASFSAGQAALQSFPAEPAIAGFDYTIIPGHLGQAWIGPSPNRFYTLSAAQLRVGNNADLRAREFGSQLPRAIVPGMRDVALDFAVYALDDDATRGLYQAARQTSPMSVMLQLGEQPQQTFGIFMNSVIADAPEYDDSETRLQWKFQNCRAQGTGDDEISIAFG